MKKDWKTVAPRAFVIAFILLAGCSSANDRTVADAKPLEVRARMFLLIDENSFEVIERTKPEWDELYSEELAKWKNPATGEFTMVPAKKCGSCGEIVPRVVFPPAEFEGLSGLQADFKKERMQAEYRCPLCGGPVYD